MYRGNPDFFQVDGDAAGLPYLVVPLEELRKRCFREIRWLARYCAELMHNGDAPNEP